MKDLRTLSHVPRWGVLRVNHRQSVADHSYYVAVYSMILGKAARLNHTDMTRLMSHALWHDVSEVFTSDIPGPIKRFMRTADFQKEETKGMINRFPMVFSGVDTPLVKEIEICGPLILAIVKMADLLDEVNYLTAETRMGNTEAMVPLENSRNRINLLLLQNHKLHSSAFEFMGPVILELLTCENREQNMPGYEIL